MDPVSQLSQSKLNDGKLKFARRASIKPTAVIGFLIVVLVIAGVLTGGYLLITRSHSSQQPAAQAPVDNSPLQMSVAAPVREIINSSTEITVVTNKVITLEDSNRATLHEVGQLDGKHYFVVRVVNLPVSETDITLKFNDASGNHFEQALKITRKNYAFPPGYTQILPWENAAYILNGDDLAVVVDKGHRLLEDYTPTDIVDLNTTFGLYTLNGATLRRDAGNALQAMLDELAKQTGKYVTIASGYRSYEDQVGRYATLLKQLGETQANTVSAKPGHSEHQLGTTVDLVSDETGWQISNNFATTAAGTWLAANCARYGFVQGKQSSDNPATAAQFRYEGVQPVQ